MKKKLFFIMLSLLFVLSTNDVSAYDLADSNEKELLIVSHTDIDESSEEGVLIHEEEIPFLYTLHEDKTRALYPGVFHASVRYSSKTGVVIEYDFGCSKCQISSVTGTASVRDYWDYNYITISANAYGNGNNKVYFSQNTNRKITAGTTNIFVDYYLYVNLLNGDILNGNRILYTVGPMTIPYN